MERHFRLNKMLKAPRKHEKELYKTFRKAWRGFIERVEPKYKGGIPDLLLAGKNNIPCFLELKIAEKLEGGTVKIAVRPAQILWFRKYPALAFLLAYMDEHYYLFDKEVVPSFATTLTTYQFKEMAKVKTDRINDIVKAITFSLI